MGGQQAMLWATRYPDRIQSCILVATAARLSGPALAFDVVARNAILRDPNYRGGNYYDRPPGPAVGLAIARMLGHITYLSQEAMTAKFDPSRLRPTQVQTAFEKRFSVGAYLAHQGDKFVERFDANSYVTLSLMMDLFDLGHSHADLSEAFAPATCRWLVISYSSDWLFPPQQSEQIVNALIAKDKPVSSCEVQTPSGHDAFFLSGSLDVYGGLIRAFLGGTDAAASPESQESPAGPIGASADLPWQPPRPFGHSRPHPARQKRFGPGLRQRRTAVAPGPSRRRTHRRRRTRTPGNHLLPPTRPGTSSTPTSASPWPASAIINSTWWSFPRLCNASPTPSGF